MMEKVIPFSPPFINEDVIREVTASLQSGWITSGPKVRDFEAAISAYNNTEGTVCVNSATSGLILALKWFGVSAGDEVIVPAYTYCATALAVMQLGATPVLADVGPDFLIDPVNFRKLINARTKAIIPVDFAGMPCSYDQLRAIVESPEVKKVFKPAGDVQAKFGRLLILNDAAHSFGARYKQKSIARSGGDITVFSFHAVKNLTTAEGGAICFNLPKAFSIEAIYKTFKLMSLNGQTKDAFTKSKGGGWKYDIILEGYKMNMPDICAAIGLAQIRSYDDQILPLRQQIFDRYSLNLSSTGQFTLPIRSTPEKESSCHIYPLRIKEFNEMERNALIDQLAARGIATNVHFIPLPMLTLFKEKGYRSDQTPMAMSMYETEISLPIYPQLSSDDVDYICELLIDEMDAVVKR